MSGCAGSTDDASILTDHDAVGISVDLERAPGGAGRDRVLLLSKPTRQVFETDAGAAWNPSNRPAWETRFGREERGDAIAPNTGAIDR